MNKPGSKAALDGITADPSSTGGELAGATSEQSGEMFKSAARGMVATPPRYASARYCNSTGLASAAKRRHLERDRLDQLAAAPAPARAARTPPESEV